MQAPEPVSPFSNSSHCVFLEIFCGTAGVSASFRRKGFHSSISVDSVLPKAPKSSVTKLDLTRSDHQALVMSWIKDPRVKAVFLAPPCGTASAARNIDIDFLQPDGVDHLTGSDFDRVAAANILYQFTADVFDLCTELNKPCMVENPRSSLFWCVTAWIDRLYSHLDCIQDHQACAYGSTRPKWTRLVANCTEVFTISLTCDGTHKYEPWGVSRQGAKRVFATALEVHYPTALCDAISHAFILHLMSQGLDLPKAISGNADAQAFSGNL